MIEGCLAKVIPMYLHKVKDTTKYQKSGLQTFVVSKSGHTNFVTKKAHLTKFCNLKKADTTNFFNQKSAPYKIL
jgi:hypothetical protein